MVKISKIYTKSGDSGSTHLVGGDSVPKSSLRIQAYGELDELNAFIGLCSTLAKSKSLNDVSSDLIKIQNELFNLGAELASKPEDFRPNENTIANSQIDFLEKRIDRIVAKIPPLTSFVLPGGTLLNSQLHIARTVCRRVERTVWKLAETENVRDCVTIYLNRLSDYLFALSRFVVNNNPEGTEILWQPNLVQNKD